MSASKHRQLVNECINVLRNRKSEALICFLQHIHNETINHVTFQDRRQGESSKAALVRQEQVRDTDKSAEVASNRGKPSLISKYLGSST